jgi:predicted SprT family Zn-dependent metalloprotease
MALDIRKVGPPFKGYTLFFPYKCGCVKQVYNPKKDKVEKEAKGLMKSSCPSCREGPDLDAINN